MTTYLATFVVSDSHSDTDAINSAVAVLDFIPIAQASNMHVFLLRTEKSQRQLATLLSECLDPADYCCVVEHPEPGKIGKTLQEALSWTLAS